MYDLTVFVPTKGRPQNAKRLKQQFEITTRADTRLVFILSNTDTDENLREYTSFKNKAMLVAPEKPGFVAPLNQGYRRIPEESFAVGFMGDDHFPATVGWDERVIDELKKLGSGLVYGNDKLQEQSIPTQIFMTNDIPQALGFMTLPRLKHLYADNFWLDLGNALGRIKYLPDVVIEHLHPAAGKAAHDDGYAFSGDFNLDQEDKRIYTEYLKHDLAEDVRKVKRRIDEA